MFTCQCDRLDTLGAASRAVRDSSVEEAERRDSIRSRPLSLFSARTTLSFFPRIFKHPRAQTSRCVAREALDGNRSSLLSLPSWASPPRSFSGDAAQMRGTWHQLGVAARRKFDGHVGARSIAHPMTSRESSVTAAEDTRPNSQPR